MTGTAGDFRRTPSQSSFRKELAARASNPGR